MAAAAVGPSAPAAGGSRPDHEPTEVEPAKWRLVIDIAEPGTTVLLVEELTGRTKRVEGPFPRAVDLPKRGWKLVGRKAGQADFEHRVDFEAQHPRQKVTIRF